MSTQNGTIIRRVVANKADLMSGPLVLADGQLGLATAEDVIVFRDLAGGFHEFASSSNQWVTDPVATYDDLLIPADGTITYVADTKSLFIRTGSGWEEVSNNDVVKKAGDTMTGDLIVQSPLDTVSQIIAKTSGDQLAPAIIQATSLDYGSRVSAFAFARGGTDRDAFLEVYALGQGVTTVHPTKLCNGANDFPFPTDVGGTIATREWTTPLLALKQTVFNGVCQVQYLTENDVSIDCTGTLPRYSINTVKNGATISASNPLCFYTDGDGVSEKWTFDAPIYVDFAYTTGIWYIHISTLGVLTATQEPWTEFGTICVLHRVYINSVLSGDARNVTEIVEYHKNDISATDHLWKHQVNGTVYLNGLDIVSNALAISATGIPTSSPNVDGRNTVVSVTSGSTLDENLQVDVLNSATPARFSQDLGVITAESLTSSNSGLFKMSYNNAGGVLTMLPATRFPFSFNASTNIPEYITATGTRTSVTNKAWIVNYVYSFGDPRFGEVVKVRSSASEYLTYANAIANSWETLQAQSPTLKDQEIRPLYKLIHYVEHSGGGAYNVATKFAGLIKIDDIRKQKVNITSATTGTVLATSVSVTPTGGIASTNVQSALAELDTEKANLASPIFTGTVSGVTASMVGAIPITSIADNVIPKMSSSGDVLIASNLSDSGTAITASVPLKVNADTTLGASSANSTTIQGRMALYRDIAPVNQKFWEFGLADGALVIQAVNDAYNAGSPFLTFNRTGATATNITASVPLLNPNATTEALGVGIGGYGRIWRDPTIGEIQIKPRNLAGALLFGNSATTASVYAFVRGGSWYDLELGGNNVSYGTAGAGFNHSFKTNGTERLAISDTTITASVPLILNRGTATTISMDSNLDGHIRFKQSNFNSGVEFTVASNDLIYLQAYDRTASAYKRLIIDNLNTDIQASSVSKLNITATSITASVPVVHATPTTTVESSILPHGVAPTTPTNGSMWTTSAGLYVRINGVTKTVTLT